MRRGDREVGGWWALASFMTFLSSLIVAGFGWHNRTVLAVAVVVAWAAWLLLLIAMPPRWG